MKKILAAAFAAIVMATSLTGCDTDNENSSGNQSSTNQGSSDNNSSNNSSSDTSNNNSSSDDTNVGDGIAKHLEEVAKAYIENVKTNPDLAFYPMQQASAEGAVMGWTNDGYLYVIVHENGEQIAKALDDPSVELPPVDAEIDLSALPYPDNRAGELGKVAFNTAWAIMEVVDDQETVDIMFSDGFDLDLCEEYFFATNIMSVHLQKCVIIKPKAGDMPA